jgi:hypothetical protein
MADQVFDERSDRFHFLNARLRAAFMRDSEADFSTSSKRVWIALCELEAMPTL